MGAAQGLAAARALRWRVVEDRVRVFDQRQVAPGCLPCLRPDLPPKGLGAGLLNRSDDGDFGPQCGDLLPRTRELHRLRCDQRGQLVIRRTNPFPHNKIIP